METANCFGASVQAGPSVQCGLIHATAQSPLPLISCPWLIPGCPFMIHCKAGGLGKVLHSAMEKEQFYKVLHNVQTCTHILQKYSHLL